MPLDDDDADHPDGEQEDSTLDGRSGWRGRRDHVLANRAVSIPTLTVKRFFEIDGIRKAMLLAFNLFICMVPLVIMSFAVLSTLRRRISLGQVMVEQFHLKNESARVIAEAFPPNQAILKVTSVIVVASFAISGFDVGSIFARTFAEAWGARPLKGWRGSLRGGVWFILVFVSFGASQILQNIPTRHGRWLYLIAIPVIMAINYLFWLVSPRLLLDKELDSADLVPGAIMGMIASTILWRISGPILHGWFDWYVRGFGAVGIALAMISWTYVVSIVWVVTVVAAAAYWERTATVDEVLEVRLEGYIRP